MDFPRFEQDGATLWIMPGADVRIEVKSIAGKACKLFAGWSADALFSIADGLHVVTLYHTGGRREAWLLNGEFAVLCDLRTSPQQREALAAQIAQSRLPDIVARSVCALLANPATLTGFHPGLLGLAAFDAGLMRAVLSLSGWTACLSIMNVAEGAAGHGIRLDNPVKESVMSDATTADGSVRLSSVYGDRHVEATWPLPLSFPRGSIRAFFCMDGGKATLRLGSLHNTDAYEARGLVLIADDKAIVHAMSTDARARHVVDIAIDAILPALLALSDAERGRLLTPPDGVALLLSGRAGGRHIGHAICDELQALDKTIVASADGRTPARVYYTSTQGGADLFGRLEDLYPELQGRIHNVEAIDTLYALMLRDRVQVLLPDGRLVASETRARITRVVRAEATNTGLAAEMDTLINAGSQRQPVVALGLRLMNRRPVDLLGFYTQIAEALAFRFGRAIIVIDGLNAGPEGKGSAAPIYSAGTRPGQQRSSGGAEIAEELAFVATFKERVRHLAVTVVNCVGQPIRPNLYTLSRCDFFVAPNGGGLAKLRWALDIPGFVFMSRANHEWCHAAMIYGDPAWMAPPFTPIYYTTPDDVLDMPMDPPTPPVRSSFIPLPNNFVFKDQSVVVGRVMDLVVQHTPGTTT